MLASSSSLTHCAMQLQVLGIFLSGSAAALKLVSLGDWGDDTTLVGSHVNEFITNESPDAVLLLGDNFYMRGVQAVDDAQFTSKFATPFKNMHCKFYACAGNHDWYGNVSAEVAYSKVNSKWVFPSLYHAHTFTDGKVKVVVAFVDTWTLNGGDTILAHDFVTKSMSLDPDALDRAVSAGELDAATASDMRARFTVNKDVRPRADAKQYKWLLDLLESNATKESDWVVVAGHFPVRSATAGEHGDTPGLTKFLDPVLRLKNRVHAYLSGHDHVLQHVYRGGAVNYFGSGAGAKTHKGMHADYKGLKAYSAGRFGYMVHEFTKTEMVTKFVSSVGDDEMGGERKVMYEFTQSKGRR
jgi:tartrate-resistant acid phosphatase type 5